MRTYQFVFAVFAIAAITATAVFQIVSGSAPDAGVPFVTLEAQGAVANSRDMPEVVGALPQRAVSPAREEEIARDIAEKNSVVEKNGGAEKNGVVEKREAKLEDDRAAVADYSPSLVRGKPELAYINYYVYAEHPPDKRPADIVLASLDGVPVGTPVEEIKRAADAFGLDFNFMKAVAKIESDFDPKQRTGRYIGLFQLDNYEFRKYGSGDIVSARDNAIAAAYKFLTEATLFEWDTHKRATFSYLYLIHQQGWQGAAEHVSHPERIAWKSMCATDEGREKGEKWCKRAIWANTLPAIKDAWKSVDNLPSAAFVQMWRERVEHLYARYSATLAGDNKH
jgi:hypothetical protein